MVEFTAFTICGSKDNFCSYNVHNLDIVFHFVDTHLQSFNIVFQLIVHIVFTPVSASYSFQTFFAGNMFWRV